MHIAKQNMYIQYSTHMSSPKKNVHEYDGLLNEYKTPYTFTIEEKHELYKQYFEVIKEYELENHKGVQGVFLVIKDTCQPPNFLDTDNIYADDVLASIITETIKSTDLEQKKEVTELVLNQMSDMLKLGRCSSGRVVRLVQIWTAYFQKD
jgi:hypothetical protein